jgi:hypothetical protein
MYSDEETLEQFKLIWLTKETNKLLNKEKKRLLEEEHRKVSKAKLVNKLCKRRKHFLVQLVREEEEK